MREKYLLDYLYLIFSVLLSSYFYFLVVLKSFHIIHISTPLYVSCGLALAIIANSVKLKLKKQKINTFKMGFFTILLVGLLYIFLFKYYKYDFLHEKDSWQFGFIFVVLVLFEAKYYFLTVDEVEEFDNLGFFEKKKKDQTDSKGDTDEPQTK